MAYISNDSIILERRKGTPDDPYVDIQQTILVKENKVKLREIPYQFDGVSVTGANKTWYEVKGTAVPTGNQYRVDYSFAIVEFDPSSNGLSLDFDYTGTGMMYLPASHVWTETDGIDVTKTLADIIAAGESAITNLDQVQKITTDAQNATDAANTAVANANTTATNIQSAESTRVSNETARQSAETTRQSQESTRQSQEQSRVTTEQGRVNAESSRVTVEQNRVTAEQGRVSQESTRQSNETTRQNDETTRQNNEAARQDTITNLAGKNAWSNTTVYKKLNIVTYNGSSYMALLDNTGVQPDTDSTKWQLVAQKGLDGTGQGTVTQVSSSNTDISVANGTTAPVLTVNSGTGANQLLKFDGKGNIGNISNPSYGLHLLGGGARIQGISTSSAPSVTPIGVVGITSYTYYVVAKDRNGFRSLVSSGATTNSGNASLSATNYNAISWAGVTGAVSYDILKGNTTTLLGSTTSTSYNDTGQSTSIYVAPTHNESADLKVDSQIASIQSTGVAPFLITSTTMSTNLNADMVDGKHASDFALSTQEAWIAPTLVNGWVNFGGAYANAGYYKDTTGAVHLHGLIKNGTITSGTVIFTLPTGYRPLYQIILSTISNNGSYVASGIEVKTNGDVIVSYASNAWLTLDGLIFRAEQ